MYMYVHVFADLYHLFCFRVICWSIKELSSNCNNSNNFNNNNSSRHHLSSLFSSHHLLLNSSKLPFH